MRSVTPLLLLIKVLAVGLTFSWAARAEDVLRNVDPAQLPWWTWAFISIFSTIGWAIAELDKMAEILFPEGLTPKQRAQATLKFAQGYVASGFAGVGIYFVAKVAPGWLNMQGDIPVMIILIAVTASAFGGMRFLSWVLARIGLATAPQRLP